MAEYSSPLFSGRQPYLEVVNCSPSRKSPSRSIFKGSGTPSTPRRVATAAMASAHSRELDSTKLIAAIQLGHTRCLRNFLECFCGPQSPAAARSPVSPTRNFNCIVDQREVPKGDYESITVKRHLIYTLSINPESLAIPSHVYEFEQTSSPLIWAVDCHKWSCLGLLCTIQTSEFGRSSVDENSCLYNPSQPHTILRRVTNSNGRSPIHSASNIHLAGQDSICCSNKTSLTNLNDATPVNLKAKLRPFAALMLSVSFSSVHDTSGHVFRSKSAQCSPRRGNSPSLPRHSGSGNHLTLSPKPRFNNLHPSMCKADLIVLVGSKGTSNTSYNFTNRQPKRPTPYRTYWIRGCYTYQSLLDYFVAVGYEMVGTNWSCKNIPKTPSEDGTCEHCKKDNDYLDYPNYPVGPWDIRNDIFLHHFSQLDIMLTASGTSASRLDSVIAFNALAISAGRRLAGWCCHGAEGDPTIYSSLENHRDKHQQLYDLNEPLIEWRILGTLIDHGLNEFEWLEFLSPQQNLIGQALCVLAWPIYGWSVLESNYMIPRKCPITRRCRRRSSSPVCSSFPLATFGVALKRQACLLLVNLWALGAFCSHHIIRASSIHLWDRPATRSHSYTATMDGGDLRRIMLKTISVLPESMKMVSKN